MQELTFEQVEVVNGGADLDWGSIWGEAAWGAVSGGSVTGGAGVLLKGVSRLGPYGALIGGAIGGGSSAYDEVIRQLEEQQAKEQQRAKEQSM